jgi:hypothetical protein
MPAFTALMSSAFGQQDPFSALVRNDKAEGDEDVRVLPVWVAESLEHDLQFRKITR